MLRKVIAFSINLSGINYNIHVCMKVYTEIHEIQNVFSMILLHSVTLCRKTSHNSNECFFTYPPYFSERLFILQKLIIE